MFQFLEQAKQNQNNPMDLFKQVTNGYSPQQMQGLFDRAKQMGVPDEYLEKVKSDISTK